MTETSNNNPWIVKPLKTKQSAPVPDGHYVADFVKADDFSHEKLDGVKWKWEFQVVTGEHTGKLADTLTDRDIDPNTHAGRIIKGLLGREIQPGENAKAAVDACKGKRYVVTVGRGPKGGKSAVRFVGPVPQM